MRARDGRDASSDVVFDVGTRGAVRDERGSRWGGDEIRGGDELLWRRGLEPRKRVGDDDDDDDDDGTGEAMVPIERVGFR